MSIMKEEILSQKYVLKDAYISNVDSVKKLADIIISNNIKLIEIASRGSSNNACVLFKYLVECLTDIRVSFIAPSIITLYNGNQHNNNSLVLAVSQGGRGEDLQIVIDNAKRNSVFTAAITNDQNSPISKKVDYPLIMNIPNEQAMAATKSFSAEMLILSMLAYALAKKDVEEFSTIGDIANSIFIFDKEINNFAKEFVNINNMFVLGRGYNLAVAKEVCCKLQETCFINATPYATSDFLHGPFAMIDNNSYVLMIVSNDATLNSNIDMLKRLKEQNANIILITNVADLQKEYGGLIIPDYSLLSPFAFTFALQLTCAYLTEELGTDPDNSRNLNKYTVTI